MTGWFVSGTDTGVGKTTVTVGLLRAAARRGLRCAGLKPVESGGRVESDGAVVGEDGAALERASTHRLPREWSRPYCLVEPVAPSVAAEREGVELDVDRMVRGVVKARGLGLDLVLVEGAGGLMVPITDSVLMVDLAARLELPVLLVARDGLGTINHTCLSVEVARGRGLVVGGVVLNAAPAGTDGKEVAENARQIERWSGVRVLGAVARGLGGVVDVPDELLDRVVGAAP